MDYRPEYQFRCSDLPHKSLKQFLGRGNGIQSSLSSQPSGQRLLPRLFTATGPMLPASSGFPRGSLSSLTTLSEYNNNNFIFQRNPYLKHAYITKLQIEMKLN